MSMDFYVSVPLSKYDELIHEATNLGFNPEFRMTRTDHLAKMGEADFARIREHLEAHSQKTFTHGPFFGLDIASLDRCLSEYSADCLFVGLEATKALGGEVMVMHTAYLPQFSRIGRRHWFRNWRDRMPRIVDRAAELGIALALENTWDDRPEILLHLADLLPQGAVKFCFDAGHVNVFSRLSVERWWGAIGDRVVAIHLHDNDGLSDDHLAPGRGTFDFPSLIHCLEKDKGMPMLDLEVDVPLADEGRSYLEFLFRSR
jgi:sugar phosphate isomerase/epimerase